MYQVIGITKLLSLYATLCAIVAVIWYFIIPPTSPLHLWSILSGAIGVAGALVWLVGMTPVFPRICRLPVIRNLFPDLDGEWDVELGSNWPEIAARSGIGPATTTGATKAKATIIARLFFVRINLESDSKYLTSKTVAAKVVRDAEDQSTRLYYVFLSTVLRPEQTDSGGHEGAAYLDIPGKGGVRELKGLYWTDRNWHQGLNTAGTVTLKRP